MDRRTEKKLIIITASLVCIAILLTGGASLYSSMSNDNDPPPGGDPGNDPEVTHGVEIGYLDHTRDGENYVWTARISNDRDYGIVWVDNTGNETDQYRVYVSGPDDWDVSADKVDLSVRPFDDMGVVMLTYILPPGTTGSHNVTVTVESVADTTVVQSLTIVCVVERTNAQITETGDTFMINYHLTDLDGNELDPGGLLPVTAGERYVGSANKIGYIDGFYLAALGLRKSNVVGSVSGETKTALVPPELGYGEKPRADGGHDLGGIPLLFTITYVSDLPD